MRKKYARRSYMLHKILPALINKRGQGVILQDPHNFEHRMYVLDVGVLTDAIAISCHDGNGKAHLLVKVQQMVAAKKVLAGPARSTPPSPS